MMNRLMEMLKNLAKDNVYGLIMALAAAVTGLYIVLVCVSIALNLQLGKTTQQRKRYGLRADQQPEMENKPEVINDTSINQEAETQNSDGLAELKPDQQ